MAGEVSTGQWLEWLLQVEPLENVPTPAGRRKGKSCMSSFKVKGAITYKTEGK